MTYFKDINEPCELNEEYELIRSRMKATVDGLREAKALKHLGNKKTNIFEKSQMYFHASLKFFEVGSIKEESNLKREAVLLYSPTIDLVWYCLSKFKDIEKHEYVSLTTQCIYYFSRRFLNLSASRVSSLAKSMTSKDKNIWDDENKKVSCILSINFKSREKLRQLGILETFEKRCSGMEVVNFISYLRNFEDSITAEDSGESS